METIVTRQQLTNMKIRMPMNPVNEVKDYKKGDAAQNGQDDDHYHRRVITGVGHGCLVKRGRGGDGVLQIRDVGERKRESNVPTFFGRDVRLKVYGTDRVSWKEVGGGGRQKQIDIKQNCGEACKRMEQFPNSATC
ncbi:unnamed protein product [Sphagnum balticum]